jgi:AcrR family transcriptional regulator
VSRRIASRAGTEPGHEPRVVESARARLTQAERVDQSTRRLLEAAAALVASQGFARTTAAQIAERAGYSREMVRVRFGSKEALIDELLGTEFRDSLRIDPTQHATGLDRLRASVQRLQEFADESPDFLRAVFVLNFEAITSPSLRADNRNWLDEVEKTFVVYLQQARADGSIRSTVDPATKARELVMISIGSAFQFLMSHDEHDLTTVLMRAVEELAHHREGAG